jgi:hypothetical protein
MGPVIFRAIKWKHPNAYSVTHDGFITAWNDPDGALQPDEATLIAEYESSGYVEPGPSVIRFETFEERFTSDEWDDSIDYIYEIDTTTGKPKRRELIQWLTRVQARDWIDLLDAKTDAFFNMLVSGGVVTELRKTEILKP